MTLLQWKDEFSVGDPSIDYEHRQLIELINEWYASLRAENSRDTRLEFLGETYAKISAHFALEEKVMRESKYDQYPEHKADHEELLDQLREIMDAEETNEEVDDEGLGRRLQAWFSEHFRTRDARLHGRIG